MKIAYCLWCSYMLSYIDMYSLEYSGMLYMLISYPRQYGKPAGLLQYSKLCKTLPLTGPGGDQLLTPSLQFFLLLKQYVYIYLFIRSI